MADADRLREAADALDESVRYAGDNPGMASWAAQNGATAALLRAVADVRGDLLLSMCYVCDNTDGHEPWCIHGCALALADSILGDN